ncbi:MAG: DUF1311 domain-containing protein [Boseongicola sp.]|nr:DUF1311 domain-containing protein [Boseongicola sp.]
MAMLGAGSAGAQELSFTMAPTEVCLADAEGVERLECVGAAAEFCMSKPNGDTTVGMGFCLGRELGVWDDRLNAAYARLRRVEWMIMEEAESADLRVPDTVTALRDMQRAWMQYRDATCTYEFSTWGGGTGGGPANTACLLDLTARQALMLEDRLEDRSR